MPELPEVQTVVDVLAPQLIGRRVEKAIVYNAQVLANQDTQTFTKAVCGSVFVSMTRRGKYMVLSLDSGCRLIIHLRMTGCLLVTNADDVFEKHTHVVLQLQEGQELRFMDQRRFGRFWLLQKNETLPVMEKLGIEPSDAALTADYLRMYMHGRSKAVKECLLDQALVAGIGNIYSDEILHRAKIHPAKKACSLSDAEYVLLAQLIPQTMAYYTETNAISPEKYLMTRGRDYQNTPFLRVYGRAGQKCLFCGTTLEKITVGGRGSVFCPSCQKPDKNA